MSIPTDRRLFITEVDFDWDNPEIDAYVRNIDALRNTSRIVFEKNITFLAGENGTGKSTLLEALALKMGFNPEGGTINYRFSTFDDCSNLCDHITVTRAKKMRFGYFLRAESFFNVATKEEEYSREGGIRQQLHYMSHGESFLQFIQNYDGEGLYILDEPEAALSPGRILTLMVYLHDMAEKGAQFIISTHSPVLLAMEEADILNFTDRGIMKCRYEDTDSYQISSMVINNRELLMHKLFDGKDE